MIQQLSAQVNQEIIPARTEQPQALRACACKLFARRLGSFSIVAWVC